MEGTGFSFAYQIWSIHTMKKGKNEGIRLESSWKFSECENWRKWNERRWWVLFKGLERQHFRLSYKYCYGVFSNAMSNSGERDSRMGLSSWVSAQRLSCARLAECAYNELVGCNRSYVTSFRVSIYRIAQYYGRLDGGSFRNEHGGFGVIQT